MELRYHRRVPTAAAVACLAPAAFAALEVRRRAVVLQELLVVDAADAPAAAAACASSEDWVCLGLRFGEVMVTRLHQFDRYSVVLGSGFTSISRAASGRPRKD